MAYFRRYYTDVHTPEFEPKISFVIFETFDSGLVDGKFYSPEKSFNFILKPGFRMVLDQWRK